jgi:hypothetical protein
MRLPLPVYWLSFVDPDRPRGDKRLGVSIVEVPAQDDEMIAALKEAWDRRCNPGGEVKATLLEGKIPPRSFFNRLLTPDEARTLAQGVQ